MSLVVLIDHLIVSGSRFLISVLLARILGLEGYGLYALLWTVVTLSGAMQIPATITPMMQIGAKSSRYAAKDFFTVSLITQLFYHLISLPIIGIAAAFIVHGKSNAFSIITTVIIYSICYNQHEFFRRYFYTIGHRVAALILDCSLYAAVGLLLMFLHIYDHVSIATYLGFSAVPAGLLCCLTFRYFPVKRVNYRRCIIYGRRIFAISSPLLVSTAANFIAGHIFIYATAIFIGISETGAITAVRNVLGPLMIMLMALENGVTRDAVLCHSATPERLRPYLQKVAMTWLVWFLLYIGLASYFSDELLGLVYGDEFATYGSLVVWLGAANIMQLFSRLQTIRLRTEGDYYAIRSASITSMWISILFSAPLVWLFDLTGAMISVLVQQSVILYFQRFPLRLDSRLNLIPVARIKH